MDEVLKKSNVKHRYNPLELLYFLDFKTPSIIRRTLDLLIGFLKKKNTISISRHQQVQDALQFHKCYNVKSAS